MESATQNATAGAAVVVNAVTNSQQNVQTSSMTQGGDSNSGGADHPQNFNAIMYNNGSH